MATQRITIAKIGGVAADVLTQRFLTWSAARQTDNPNERSSEQWPPQVRQQANDFVDRLRADSFTPPVVHFIEWIDMWSMGDLFDDWLRPPKCPSTLVVMTDRFAIYAYSLPDEEQLSRYLSAAGPQQFPETDWIIARLREAVSAWDKLVERAVIVVLRDTVGKTVDDEEVSASLESIPGWLT